MKSAAPSTGFRLTPSLIVGVIVGVVLLLLGLSTLILQKQLRESTSTQSKASSNSGVVEISQTNNTLTVNSDSTINLTINTHSAQISGIQVLFQVVATQAAGSTPAFGTAPTIQVTNPNLHAVNAGQLTPIVTNNVTTGYLYSNIIIPAVGQGYSSNGEQPLLSISFKPESATQYVLTFDGAGTAATIYRDTQDVLKTAGSMTFAAQNSNCTYTYSEWSSCQNGKQIRTFTANPASCSNPEQTELERSCSPQCHYEYSNWSNCSGGWQTRTQTTQPANCTWYTQDAMEELSRSCGGTNPNFGLYPYTYEACWRESSDGKSSYIVWNKNELPNVTKLEISTYSDFHEYAGKTITAPTVLGADYLVADLSDLRTVSDGKNGVYTLYPDKTYYLRLSNGAYSGVIRFYVPTCSGTGGTSGKQCNESCSSNADCANNLACHNGQCRRAGNVTSTACVLPPDGGLKRACNDYCADNRECAAGLTCSWNRCRNPQNLSSTSCAAGTTTTSNTAPDKGDEVAETEVQCNQTCASNRDCALGLRCYENRCRLPANLASVICSETELGTEEPVPTSASQGTTLKPTATITINSPADSTDVPDDKGAKTGLIAMLMSKFPYILLAILLGIIAITILSMLLRGRSEPARSTSSVRPPNVPPAVPTPITPVSSTPSQNPSAADPQSNGHTSMMERLKQRGVQPPGI